MVRCDMEGIGGIVSYEQAEPGRSEYAFGQRMFMEELLALLEGLREGGAEEVFIYDEHYYGRNIDVDRLPGYARAICGKPPYRMDWAGGLDESFSGMALLGFHSKALTPGGLLPHSYELDISDLVLNGVSVGEIGMEAAIAGDFNVPATLIVGDSAGVREATTLLPGIIGAVVKDALSESGAVCYPLSVVKDRVRAAAAKAARGQSAAKPYRAGPAVTLKIILKPGPYRDALAKLYGGPRNDADYRGQGTPRHSGIALADGELEVRGKSATEVWASYWEMKLRGQATMRAGGANGA